MDRFDSPRQRADWLWLRAAAILIGLLCAGSPPLVSQTLVTNPAPFVTTNIFSGPTSERINLVVMGDGYTSNQLAAFQTDVTNVVLNYFFTVEPYRSYRSYFNVFSISAASLESGSDHPEATPPVAKDTYFNSTYNTSGIARLLTLKSSSRAYTLANQFVPNYNILLVIVNDTTYGGSGGTLGVTSINSSSPQIVVHELGHSFGGLKDEYDTHTPGYSPYEAVNCTAQTNAPLIKWTAWIDGTTLVPTPASATYSNTVGLFLGCMYSTNGWYRPHYNSCMRSLGKPYGPVNVDQLIKRIYHHTPDHIAPFHTVTPTNASLTVSGLQTLPFSVRVMQPEFHSLAVGWFLDGVSLPGQSATNLAISTGTIGLGTHSISCVVSDTTAQVRIYTNSEFVVNPLTKTMTWTVNVASLGNADSVGDGIPDSWRADYFPNVDPTGTTTNELSCATCDADGTGQNNRFKYQAGLNPTNPASIFRILSIVRQTNDLLVTWQTVGGKTNVLQAAADLTSSYRNVSANIVVLGSGDTSTNYLDTGGATNEPARIYRILLIPGQAP